MFSLGLGSLMCFYFHAQIFLFILSEVICVFFILDSCRVQCDYWGLNQHSSWQKTVEPAIIFCAERGVCCKCSQFSKDSGQVAFDADVKGSLFLDILKTERMASVIWVKGCEYDLDIKHEEKRIWFQIWYLKERLFE